MSGDHQTTETAPAEIDLKQFGWAPGGYWIKCMECGGNGMPIGGDKRSLRCHSCAQALRRAMREPCTI